jgi:hypothetical protein
MSVKKDRVRVGRKIRKTTGLSFPVSMRAAKIILRSGFYELRLALQNQPLLKESPAKVEVSYFSCGPECCGSNGYKLIGPKGEYLFY